MNMPPTQDYYLHIFLKHPDTLLNTTMSFNALIWNSVENMSINKASPYKWPTGLFLLSANTGESKWNIASSPDQSIRFATVSKFSFLSFAGAGRTIIPTNSGPRTTCFANKSIVSDARPRNTLNILGNLVYGGCHAFPSSFSHRSNMALNGCLQGGIGPSDERKDRVDCTIPKDFVSLWVLVTIKNLDAFSCHDWRF